MYFLKKFASFGKNSNVEGEAAANPTSCGPECSSEGGMDKENSEIVKDEGTIEYDIESSPSASSLGIPDCFFDEVPETSSSDNSSQASSADTDSQFDEDIPAETFRDDYEDVQTSKFICESSVDVSPQIPNEAADEIDSLVEDNAGKESITIGGSCGIGGERPVPEECRAENTRICRSEESSDGSEEKKDEEASSENDECEDNSSGDVKNTPIDTGDEGKVTHITADEKITRDVFDRLTSGDIDCYDDFAFHDENETCDVEWMRNLWKSVGVDDDDEAEARLAARRQARVEAREIRLRELERQQKEQEENADRAFDMSYAGDPILRTGRVTPSGTSLNARDRSMATGNSYHSSRRSSEDSIEEGLTLRDIRHELKEAEEKFKKAMIANAQLDNEKSALAYQVELLKDRFEDLEETHAQLTREHRDKCREHEQVKRAAVKLKEDLEFYKINLMERDRLITEYGLVIVDAEEDGEGKPRRTLVSAESADLLQQAGSGSLDVRLKKFSEERNELLDEIRHLKLELEEERSKRIPDNKSGCGSLTNGPLDEETSKILSDYKFKLQKAEQDVSTLQANVARLESQVIRYKTAAESSEKAEDELKIEKRKLQRENRESIARIEELETENSHLQRRMDKLKNAKSTLLKEL